MNLDGSEEYLRERSETRAYEEVIDYLQRELKSHMAGRTYS